MDADDRDIMVKMIQYTNESFKGSWSIQNGRYIPYGIPNTKTDLSEPRKSIVLIGIDSGKSGELLYSHIKNQFPDAGIINDISNMSYDNITDILKEHHVCITFRKSFDSLVALSCGCDVLSSSYLSENGIVQIEDFNKINLMIESSLRGRDNKIVKQRVSDLIKKYDLEIFQNEIYNTIRKRIRKPFIL